MKNSILFLLLLFFIPSFLFALNEQEIASKTYQIRVGKGNDLRARSVDKKTILLPQIVQTSDGKPVAGVDYTNAIILDKILKANKKSGYKQKKSGMAVNYLKLPKTYVSDMKDYNSQLKEATLARQAKSNKKQNILVIARCRTYQDYKINGISSLKMMCKTRDNSKFLLHAKVEITYNKKPELKAIPYMLEDVNGDIYSIVQNKSFLYNAINGSVNLATYVNKRALAKISKAMANTVGTEVPKMTNDYLNKKYAASSSIAQTNNGNSSTTYTTTNTPKPAMSDYGLGLLVKVISSGIKAGADQLYQNLGYIYYIPKGSIVDAEIVYTVSNGNKK